MTVPQIDPTQPLVLLTPEQRRAIVTQKVTVERLGRTRLTGIPLVDCALCKRRNRLGASIRLCVRCRDRYLEITAEQLAERRAA